MNEVDSLGKPYFWVLPSAATVDPSQSLNLRIVAFAHNDHARDLTTGSDMNGMSSTYKLGLRCITGINGVQMCWSCRYKMERIL